VYVDDVIVTGSSTEAIINVKTQLKERFEMTDSGACKFVLGIELVDNADGSVTLCQRRYIDDILKRFGMEDCKPVATPVDISAKIHDDEDASRPADVPYREAVGALMHLMCATRPDIAFAVGMVSRFMESPKDISTGQRSSALFATCKAPSHTVFASTPASVSTFKRTRTPTGPAM
jgi:hypothetical protein